MIKRLPVVVFLVLAALSCKNDPKPPKTETGDKGEQAQKTTLEPSDERAVRLMDSVIANAGGKRYETATMQFIFRDTMYISHRNCGQFQLMRKFVKQNGDTVTDILKNEGFHREVMGQTTQLPDKKANAIKNKINSVHYFTQLPFGLNDPAVHKYYLGASEINGQKYQKLKVLFEKAGGGKDHQDQYRYWVNDSTHTMDYLAYSYETGDGGMRFREAVNPRVVNGIRFVDYKNYAPQSDTLTLSGVEKAFIDNELKLYSTIENTAVKVKLGDKNCD